MSTILKKTIFAFLLTVSLLGFFLPTWAQSPTDIPSQPGKGIDLPALLKWVFDVGLALGFISVLIAIVVSGAYFALSSTGSAEMRGKAKEWFTGAMSGLLIFLLFYLIITTVNPNLAIFNFGKPLQTPAYDPSKDKPLGIYFYTEPGCEGNPVPVLTSSIYENNSRIQSVEVVSDTLNGSTYFAFIYSKQKHKGVCQYVGGLSGCSAVDAKINDIESVFVARADLNFFGSPVEATLYRNPTFKDKGGKTTVKTRTLFNKKLSELYFTEDGSKEGECTVPEDEQDCQEWDKDFKCIKRVCPALEGDNIASLEVNKDTALVILGYWGPEDNGTVLSHCQTYPSVDDVNKMGSHQISWDLIHYNSLEADKKVYPTYPNYIRVIKTKK